MGIYVSSVSEIQWALPRSVDDLLFGWNGLAKTIILCGIQPLYYFSFSISNKFFKKLPQKRYKRRDSLMNCYKKTDWSCSSNILTYANFIRTGLTLVNWSCMCRCSNESMNYVLLDCDTANGMGISVFYKF